LLFYLPWFLSFRQVAVRVQANLCADGIQNAFEIDTWKSGIVVSLNLVLLYLVGKRIKQICRSHNGHLYCNCIGDHSDRYRSTPGVIALF
jgi:Na+/alanine symporter